MNPTDDQNAFLLFDLTGHICRELLIAGVNLARFQRASEGAHHSTGRRRDHVIDGGSVGFFEFRRIHFIVLRYRSMHAVSHRLRFSWQMCDPQRTTFAFDVRLGGENIARSAICVGCQGGLGFDRGGTLAIAISPEQT
jgi:hypothetical protein